MPHDTATLAPVLPRRAEIRDAILSLLEQTAHLRRRFRTRVTSVVESVYGPAASDCQWVIRPNQSLSWRAAFRLYVVVAFALLGMSLGFALKGFWPVLPFFGLELLVLGAALYLCLERSQWREIIRIDSSIVRVEKGRRQVEEHWECPRFWARVQLEKSPIAWYPTRLMIRYQGRRVEIGGFLSNDERTALADALSRFLRERLDEPRHHE